MDEILHHCLRELAFDGDLGSNVSRLRDFIVGFYDHGGARDTQNQDDMFCAYVWSLLVQHPNVIVGVVPEAIVSEVWVAPQVSAKRKATARGEDLDSSPPPKLEVISEPKETPLNILIQKYGERLRMATDAGTTLSAITGSHIRSPKLTPMVYTALQIVTRGRDAGVSVVELGKKSGYDQKTCFYLVRQLTDLDLVLKVRRGGVGTHFVIHKYFYERNPSWKAIRQEEQEAELQVKAEKCEIDDEEDQSSLEDHKSLNFTSIDARHLSSYPLISRRVIRLLEASKNHIHASKDMLIRLGFSNPTKTDRRFFRTRINEMIQKGLVEKVIIPNKQKTSVTSVKCLRLLDGHSTAIGEGEEGIMLPDPDDNEDEIASKPSIKFNATIHKQIIDLIEESGTRGMTLSDLSSSLHGFDKRTIELLLTRSEKSLPPLHILDLHVVGIMEISGRERRHRYYTVKHYRQLVNEESLDNETAGYNDVDLNDVGGFSDVGAEVFYETGQGLARYTDSFKSRHNNPEKKKKTRVYKNPILPDGRVKRGRPRKGTLADENTTKKLSQKGKRKRGEERQDEQEERPSKKIRLTPDSSHPVKRGRGRPKKKPGAAGMTQAARTTRGNKNVPQEHPELQTLSVAVTQPAPLNIPTIAENVEPTELEDVGPSLFAVNQATPGHDEDLEERATSFSAAIISSQTETLEYHDSAGALPTVLKEAAPFDTNSTPSQMTPIPSGSASRVNVSHLRRENEFMRLLENSGGILSVHLKDFYESHIKLLENLVAHGEPTSAPPGTRTDKRTMVSTFTSLERKGRVKQLKTSITSLTGLNRPAHVIYLPDVDGARLNAFLDDLGRVQPQLPQLDSFVKIDEHLEFGAEPSVPLRLLQFEEQGNDDHERRRKNFKSAKQLFNHDDSEIRDVLRSERTVMMQCYGFIMGKALRCRQLHLTVLEALEQHAPSPNIVSHDKRILDIAFFLHDLPVELYCSLVAPLTYDETLSALLANDIGRKTLVRDLPSDLQTSLQIGRSRSRTRFLDMLEKLRSLDLLTPLQPSESSNPLIDCSANGRHPTKFDAASLEGWTITTPALAPSYWLFKSSAPIHLWAASESNPPFWKRVHVSGYQDGVAYWKDLQNACLDATQIQDTEDLQTNIKVAKSFRRPASWRADYVLSWHQTQYLRQIMGSLGLSPLDVRDPSERESLLTRICWVTSAPLKVVEDYFISHKEKLVKTLEKVKEGEKRSEETRVSFVKKSEEARLQREHEWSSLLCRCHPTEVPPSAVIRIKRIHKQFIQAGSVKDMERWEKEIQEALRETNLANMKGLKISKHQPPQKSAPVNPPCPSICPQELTIDKLIELQGPPIEHDTYKRKRKRKKEEEDSTEESKKVVRRHRFQWNPDFDELARDASIVIRARCRDLPRLDWAAFEQVFPAVPRNTVRQRLVHIKENPGNEAYLRRLEDVWYDLWVKNRGTEALPDTNIHSPSDFDLVKHIQFLRTNVDKHALRVGISQATEKKVIVIPATLEQLQEQFEIVDGEQFVPEWEYIWNTTIEEGREKKLKRQAFLRSPATFTHNPSTVSDEIVVAECAVKIAMGSPPERYDSEQASSLLKSCGNEAIGTATRNLLNAGILSKLQRDPKKRRPGRMFKISESNQNAIGGNISQDTFQDAGLLLEEMELDDTSWHEWPLIATDGDCTALIQLTSEDKVNFMVDTSLARAARPALDWNSKKADDDHIEPIIKVQYHLEILDEEPFPRSEVFELPQEIIGDPVNHGFNNEGHLACCRRISDVGLVDCAACLDEAWKTFCNSLDLSSCDVAQEILRCVNHAKEHGLKKSDFNNLNFGTLAVNLPSLLNKMFAADIPQIYWTGYESLVFISARHVAKWSVAVSQTPLVYLFPRRWVDIKGQKVADFWQAAVRAVIGCVIFRPGISQSEIRWRLRSVYDKQEIIDVLRYLSSEGFLTTRFASQPGQANPFFPYDEQEESQVYWFIGDKHWYQA